MTDMGETGIKFDLYTDPLFDALNPKWCQFHPPHEVFHLKENSKQGKTDISVFSSYPCFAIEHFENVAFQVVWRADDVRPKELRQCADHVVFCYDRETRRWILHIFEMTVKIDWYKWDGEGGRYPNGSSKDDARKIQNQFNGALIRASAVLGILRGIRFERVYLHCVYRRAEDLGEGRLMFGKLVSENYLEGPISLPYCSVPVSEECPVPPPELHNVPIKVSLNAATGTGERYHINLDEPIPRLPPDPPEPG